MNHVDISKGEHIEYMRKSGIISGDKELLMDKGVPVGNQNYKV